MTALAQERTGARSWGAAAALTALAHAGAVWAALHARPSPPPQGEPPPAVLIELAPVPAAPPALPQEVAPGPLAPQADPPPAPEKPVEDLAEPPVAAPPLPKVADAPAILPSRPQPVRPRVAELVKPPPRRPEKPRPARIVPQERAAVKRAPASRQASAPPSTTAPSAFVAVAPAPSASQPNAGALASWKGALLAHINRFKRYPPGANGAGTAYVVFTINATGAVTSARLTSSSGDAALDGEAVALLRRASPTPPPPSGGVLTLNVPIRFNRE